MTSLFSTIGDLITCMTTGTASGTVADGWIGKFVNCITSNPFLLFFVGLSLVGVAVGFITRLIRVR